MKNSLILIVESGSTKTDWFFIDEKAIIGRFVSVGYNPSFQHNLPEGFITADIASMLRHTGQIYYYGAGTASSAAKERVSAIFLNYEIEGIEINSDMFAACRATCGDDKGYVAILGTGSNTAFYDGVEMKPLLPALGYILGDDGSGNAIGKKLLRSYYYKQMPEDVSKIFESKYQLDKSSVITDLNESLNPAKYLGSYTYFLNEVEGEWSNHFLKNIFRDFVALHFVSHKDIDRYPLHFVGSIAYQFKNQLTAICKEYKLQLGEILKSPDTKLIDYHIKKL